MFSQGIKISIIVPVSMQSKIHNGFIDWVCHPSLSANHEVVIVIDHTTLGHSLPENETIIARLQTISPSHVRIIQTDLGNPGKARNLGLDIATGDWIYFWDADDSPNVDKAIELVQSTHSVRAQIGIGLANRCTESSRYIIGNSWWGIYRWPGIWRFAFERRLIRNLKFQPWNWCEDQDFIARSLNLASTVYLNQESIYCYVATTTNSLTKDVNNWIYLKSFLHELSFSSELCKYAGIRRLFFLKTILALSRHVSIVEIFHYALTSFSSKSTLVSDRFPKIKRARDVVV